jgi:hypothetical protein
LVNARFTQKGTSIYSDFERSRERTEKPRPAGRSVLSIIPDRRRRNGSETMSSAKNSANPRQISAGERQQFGATAIPAKPV